ncbi:2Fe-2S iron-sulfur cluster-binding protein [Methylibium sp.]|uniref:2Fe-2S iron-sulfur cluster-binding protein n=1 Tax=Methylibium sp. TaxID=2067992 RepID=UPI003342DA4F
MKIEVKARNRAHAFDAEPGSRVLYAGLGQAIDLPYECGSGTCGTCKARLLSGEIDDLWPEAPGRKYLKQADEFLMCQCAARGPLSIEVASFVEDLEPDVCVPRTASGRIVAARLLTHDVMSLRIALAAPMPFDAGQFVLVQVPGIDGYRGWSMVNHVKDALELDFVIKKKPDGKLSDWLFSATPAGTSVELFGPLGSATFYPELDKNILCIAGGSGIAGMMSILERAARADYFAGHDGDVFFGVRSMKDAFFLDEFSRLRATCGERLRVTVAFSEEPASDALRASHPLLQFDTGFVHEVAGRSMQGRYQGVRAYLAGPPPAVDACVRMLLMARVSTDNIRYDKFS